MDIDCALYFLGYNPDSFIYIPVMLQKSSHSLTRLQSHFKRELNHLSQMSLNHPKSTSKPKVRQSANLKLADTQKLQKQHPQQLTPTLLRRNSTCKIKNEAVNPKKQFGANASKLKKKGYILAKSNYWLSQASTKCQQHCRESYSFQQSKLLKQKNQQYETTILKQRSLIRKLEQIIEQMQ